MKSCTVVLIIIFTFLLEGCTPSMDVSINYSNINSSDELLELHFEFVRNKNKTPKPVSLNRVWIYNDDKLVLDMEKSDYSDGKQYTWNFPSIPKGFRITFPENLEIMPSFSKKDHLKFSFLAGGGYDVWEYKPIDRSS